jgi:hypothetical protein
MPLNVTVLVPGLDPNPEPETVTNVLALPEVGERLVIWVVTVNVTPLLANPPTVTTTGPVVACVGTIVAILVELQLVGAAVAPLNVTELVPCVVPKFDPVIVTVVPTKPEVGDKLLILGETVKLTPLL